MTPSALCRQDRALEWAHSFLDEVRADYERAARQGCDVPPRLRTVHERQGHATPEYRNLALTMPSGTGGASPDILSAMIASFARDRLPSCMMLVLDAQVTGEPGGPVCLLIAEARDRSGSRYFLTQRFRRSGSLIVWEDPLDGGWRDPGAEEMILDASFA